MSLIGSLVGAFVGLMARPKPPQEDLSQAYDNLNREYETMRRSREQLINHVELLERELMTQRSLAEHWLSELQRTIRERPLPPHPQQVALNQAMAQQHQMEMMRNIPAPMQSLGQAAQNALAQYQAQANAFNSQFDGFCNCVPSRAQVWAAERGP